MSANRQEYEKYYVVTIMTAYAILLLNIYYFAHPLFAKFGLTHEAVRNVMLMFRNGGVFESPLPTKGVALALLAMTHVIRTGKGKKANWWLVGGTGAGGLVLYVLWPASGVLYILFSLAGFVLMGWCFASIGRNLAGFMDPNNDPLESWKQCDEKIDTPDSINLPLEYKWKGKLRHGWVNILNSYRASIVFGTPGAGKSYSVINPYIQQSIEKGYCMMCYDYKYPDLSKIVYNEYLLKYPPIRNRDYKPGNGQHEWIKDPEAPSFYIINFNDPRKSHRCNPIHPSYITDPADSAEIADIVMKNVAPGTVEKEDFFSMSAKVFLDAIIYFLSIYKGGKYCTFPHAIELLNVDYKKVFAILSSYEELETKITPFASALEANAQDQLQGQIASATIPLNKMASPALYWILSGDDFRLDLNNPQDPKFLCIGNDPDRQAIYGTALALFTSRIFKLINHKGKRKIMIILDELPTIFIKGLDNLIATARSNKVAICAGVQDESQLVRDYSQKEADVILNTIANVFVGNVKGKTAEKFSKSFGREFREQQSQTINIDSESIQRSYHQEELLQISTIENLSRGYFFGQTTDDNTHIQEQKMFYGRIEIDVKGWEERRSNDQPMPVINDFGEAEIRAELHEEMNANAVFNQWAARQILEEGIIYDSNELAKQISLRVGSLTNKEKEKMIEDEVNVRVELNVDTAVKKNFLKIREEIRDLVRTELPDEDQEFEDEYEPEGEENPINEILK